MDTSSPSYDIDFYSRELIEDPYPHYRAIRDLGPVVHLPRHDLFAIGRFEDVRHALRADEVLISGRGVSANTFMNTATQVTTLVSDGERHRKFKRLAMKPITAGEMKLLRGRIQSVAEELIDRLVTKGRFEGMRDMAQFLPVTVVSHLVGLPEAGRENMLKWASAIFDALGSFNKRAQVAMPWVRESFAYAQSLGRADVVPDGWAARLFDAADEGIIKEEMICGLLQDYVGPSLDTTIFATGHLLYRLGNNPEQWQQIREDPSLIPGAVHEVLRIESPIRSFTRYVNEDFEVGGTVMPKGSRAVIIYASANHDERKFPNPERFDIHRKNADHVGFGYGVHRCMGVHLARLELRTLLEVMVERVKTIEVGEPTIAINNILRGFSELPVEFR
ncbi:MAG: cytochrome P450 [Deltaproteobacteria bacterium]|nr:cytochrome P450 [Deltaproteobacteria bacterium]